ncbi:hypothetical protein [Rhodococcus sp. PD04]|uniref:hypothetical protein n=1 Tax=Rhodococcus sp. PD04 TaxID=3109594 RepID=UPI002DD99379|nr:hypothetical protein [Rhodococcus sp. PD04]WSE23839.1 hypothetical protein U9J23_05945 [Rhodococcus sp. PD04]
MNEILGDWTPEELAAQRAQADQVLAVLKEAETYDSPLCDDKLQRAVDRVMARMRRACTTVPEELRDEDFRGGGGRDLAPLVDPAMPKWSKDFPEHAPVVLFSWRAGNRWIVRIPLRPSDVLGMPTPPTEMECVWHRGPVTGEASYLTVARGQYVIALVICGRCRRSLDRKYPEALRWAAIGPGTLPNVP